MFKLYLYGIEIVQKYLHHPQQDEFKLYLYGIEISNRKDNIQQTSRSNCTFMELKFARNAIR